jgi:uncharacterized membrane protein YeaQ/YmgE (transglycosylase-associated protein family)
MTIVLAYGAIAGWIGKLFKINSLKLTGSVIAGISGSLISYFICTKVGINSGEGWLGYILTSGFGAFFLLAVINLTIPRRI